jgi:type III pantothenate kinase
LYPDQNTLVVAVGTCITYNFINKFGEFLGGAISPGMEMRFKVMHTETAKLPLVKQEWNTSIIGYDTASNLKSGVIWGIVYEIDGFIEEYSNRYGCFNAVLTGGNGVYFAGQLKNRIFADPNFIFKGLLILSELNN